MSSKAKSTGREIIAVEREMDIAFANHTMTPEALKLLTSKSAELQGQLRFVHLSAHLDTMQILTAEQVQKYIEMRGYDGGHGRNAEHDGYQMHSETS